MRDKFKKKTFASRVLAMCLSLLMVMSVAVPSGVFAQEAVDDGEWVVVDSQDSQESIGTELETDVATDWETVETSADDYVITEAEDLSHYGTYFEYSEKQSDEFGNEYVSFLVTAKCDETAMIPETAQLHVDRLYLGSPEYEAAYNAVLANMNLGENETLVFVPYDIYFMDGDNRIEPQEGKVAITMSYSEAPIEVSEDETVSDSFIAHIAMNGQVEQLTDEAENNNAQYEFKVEGFSIMGPVEVHEKNEVETTPEVTEESSEEFTEAPTQIEETEETDSTEEVQEAEGLEETEETEVSDESSSEGTPEGDTFTTQSEAEVSLPIAPNGETESTTGDTDWQVIEDTEETTEPDGEEEVVQDDSQLKGIDFVVKGKTSALGLHGTLAVDPKAAADAIAQQKNIEDVADEGNTPEEIAENLANELLRKVGLKSEVDGYPEEYPRQADDTQIEYIETVWMTKDTVDNGDDALLYIKPSGDNDQNVRVRVKYALSGEHGYDPGDVVITVPAYIFKNRNGNDYGKMVIPFPEDPSTKNDFNWKQVGDNIVLTNTKRMAAASTGYIEFGIYNLTPHELVDMQESKEFRAYIEVVTYKDNIVGLHSNAVTAEFDTEARVQSANKRQYNSTKIVTRAEVPASIQNQFPDEEFFVVASWYMWAHRSGNTMYTIDIEDTIPDEYQGVFYPANNWAYDTNEDGSKSASYANYLTSYQTGQTGYSYMNTVYPFSQFEEGVTYTFHNNVTYTLTEVDPEVGDDPQLVTTATANAQLNWSYQAPRWIDPQGHYNVFKNGNDYETRYTTHKGTYSYSDTLLHSNGYYGIYPSALNDLRDQKDVDVSYTINTIGYIMPWTYDPTGSTAENPARVLSNYFKRPVQMITTDTGMAWSRGGEALTVGTDYHYKSVQVSAFQLYKGVPQNVNDDGSFTAMHAGDGTFLYSTDSTLTNRPDIDIEIQRGSDTWEKIATVSWKSGAQVTTTVGGEVVADGKVALPADTTSVRGNVTSTNAGLTYDLRVSMTLHPTETTDAMIEQLFVNNYTPSTSVWNNSNMYVAYGEKDVHDPGQAIVSIDKDGYDSLRGFTTDIAVYPSKTGTFDPTKDVDVENRTVKVHYRAEVDERSFIADRSTYEQAIQSGTLVSEHSGVWFDLLPKGVTPVMNSIRLRSGDTIKKAYTVPDYKGSGRTLLVVEADLTPVTATYKPGDITYYQDVITIQFDALYGWDDWADYGKRIHNVIGFQGSNDFLGTVDNYSGENAAITTSNNVATQNAFVGDERELMGNFSETDKDVFVFAGAWTNMDFESTALVNLNKDVQVNHDGRWSTGTYYGQKEQEERNVYTGGVYQYRLRMMPQDGSSAKNMVIYDSLENFVPGALEGNDEIDIGAPRWQGEFISVDVSQLEKLGCAPVVYYSTVPELQLVDESYAGSAAAVNVDLTNSSIWSSTPPADMSKVKAIAIDMSKDKDNKDFVLGSLTSATIVVNMRAPEGEEAQRYIDQAGVWGDSAMAYNEVFMMTSIIDNATGQVGDNNFVRKDYTKVGLMPYNLEVSKVWDDANNRDGKRPEDVVVHLMRTDVVANETVDTGLQVTLNEDNEWKDVFKNIQYCNPDGVAYAYSLTENEVADYEVSFSPVADGAITVTNKHVPEKITVEGEKQWVGDEDNEKARPSSIQVLLYADGVFSQQKTIRADADGNWHYDFPGLYKYVDGREIKYTVEERVTETAGKSYTSEVAEDGRTIINTYHPVGDLVVTKTAVDVTDVSGEEEFEFTFRFVKGTGDDAMPVTDPMPYVITEKRVVDDETVDVEVAKGELICDDTLSIKAGQQIYISDIPEYVNYTVTETKHDGFTATRDEFTGVIYPSTVSRADFVNKYAADGRLQLSAEKELKNRALTAYQFRFELFELVKDENGEYVLDDNGKATEKVLRTATNARPYSTTYVDEENTEGPVDHSNAEVTFGAIRYTQKDVGDYTYFMRETNTGKDGFTYDGSLYEVKVHVVDKADGTLDVTHEIAKIVIPEDDEGNPVEVDLTGDYETEPLDAEAKAQFVNEYHAKGELVLRAWKTLKGRDLKADEFEFELLDAEGNPVYKVDENGEVTDEPVTAKNTADGSIVFDALKYDEKDIGLTYSYAICEKAGTDPTVNYDDSVYGYQVIVYDNGDGTLSFSQTPATPIVEKSGNDGEAPAPFTMPISYLIRGDQFVIRDTNTIAKEFVNLGDVEWQGEPDVSKIEKVTYTGASEVLANFMRDQYGDKCTIGDDNVATYYAIYYGETQSTASYTNSLYTFGYEPYSSMTITGWTTDEGELPVFKNTLKEGKLSVSKYVTNPDEADPNQEFTFKVVLIGEDVDPSAISEFELREAPEREAPVPNTETETEAPSDAN